MSQYLKSGISSVPKELRKISGLKYPVTKDDVIKFVDSLGGKFSQDKDTNREATLEKIDSNSFEICLKKHDLSDEELIFLIICQIGHLLLHLGFILNEEKWKSADVYKDPIYETLGYSIEQRQAEDFALDFLMPDDEFEKAFKKNKANNGGEIDNKVISKTANHFGVSFNYCLFRARQLNLIV